MLVVVDMGNTNITMGFKSTGLFHSIPNLFFRIVFFAS